MARQWVDRPGDAKGILNRYKYVKCAKKGDEYNANYMFSAISRISDLFSDSLCCGFAY